MARRKAMFNRGRNVRVLGNSCGIRVQIVQSHAKFVHNLHSSKSCELICECTFESEFECNYL